MTCWSVLSSVVTDLAGNYIIQLWPFQTNLALEHAQSAVDIGATPPFEWRFSIKPRLKVKNVLDQILRCFDCNAKPNELLVGRPLVVTC